MDGKGMPPAILFDIVERHIAVVTLNRPEARNAVNGAIAQELDAAVKRIEADRDIRVAILRSSHAGVFCAGADLKLVAAGRKDEMSTPDHGFAGFVEAPRRKPYIAAVLGAAMGGGWEIALACDMIVASDQARFALPEVKRGLFAGAGGAYRLPRALPRNIALELIATGDVLEAPRAYSLGMVNRLVRGPQVDEAALELARAIVVNAPISVAESLVLARATWDSSEPELHQLALQGAERLFASEDAKEGPRAFIEKRTPVWRGA